MTGPRVVIRERKYKSGKAKKAPQSPHPQPLREQVCSATPRHQEICVITCSNDKRLVYAGYHWGNNGGGK